MTNDMNTVRGVVEATAQNKPDRFGVRIGGEWYDGFGDCPVQKGDDVAVTFTHRGRFRNIHEVSLVTAGQKADASEETKRESRIARAVALKCATKLFEGSPAKAPDVLELAATFEGWLRATPRRKLQEPAPSSSSGTLSPLEGI